MNNHILLVDDHPAVRTTLRILLEREGFEIIGETDNGVDALKLAQKLLPGIMILDIGIPLIDGLTVIQRLQGLNLSVKIIVLTGENSNHLALRCLQSGAQGFLSKQSELCELISAVRAVAAGGDCFPSSIPPINQWRDVGDIDDYLLASLSFRELRVLQQLSQGMSNKMIAEHMLLSAKTVSTYKTRLLKKLEFNTVIELFDWAKRNELA